MNLLCVIITLTVSYTEGGKRINSFGVLDGKVCQSSHRSFTIQASSLMSCSTGCLASSSCRSFFYSNISGNCYGCRHVSNGDGLLTQQGTVYYIRIDKIVVLASDYPTNGGIGLALVWHDNQWGTVCNDNWERNDAGYTENNVKVFCKTI